MDRYNETLTPSFSLSLSKVSSFVLVDVLSLFEPCGHAARRTLFYSRHGFLVDGLRKEGGPMDKKKTHTQNTQNTQYTHETLRVNLAYPCQSQTALMRVSKCGSPKSTIWVQMGHRASHNVWFGVLWLKAQAIHCSSVRLRGLECLWFCSVKDVSLQFPHAVPSPQLAAGGFHGVGEDSSGKTSTVSPQSALERASQSLRAFPEGSSRRQSCFSSVPGRG